MLKPQLFRRELAIYEEMATNGTHYTQSAKRFTADYYGMVYLVSKPQASSSTTKTTTTTTSSLSPALATNRKQYSCPYLVLSDLTKNCSKPCAIDIKIGLQSYAPDALDDKKLREYLKYPFQR